MLEKERPQKAGLKVAFSTFGCRSNYADTVDLKAACLEHGAELDSGQGEADVYVLNTCSVTDAADREAFREARRIKKKSPNARVLVTGCAAESRAREFSALAEVDGVVGPGRKKELISEIFSPQVDGSKAPSGGTPSSFKERRKRHSISLSDPISPFIPGPGQGVAGFEARARYHLRIQEGCDNFCTFCIIPSTRGSLSSRSIDDIVNDIKYLQRVGYREVVLTGTHLGGYGQDFGSSLLELLQILAKIPKVPRLRLSSIDPNDLSEELICLLSSSNVFCEHLHICLQAFSDRILKRMNRKYALADVYPLLEFIRKKVPGICLGSDVIAGFPGETAEDFERSVEIFEELQFS